MSGEWLLPAFADPAQVSQQVFRRALSALSEPGLIQQVVDAPGLDRLSPATYALCLCLLDGDTPLWLSPSLDTPRLRANLAFHCGCPFAEAPEQAAFALLDGGDGGELPAFNPGTDRDPHLSCTVMIQLERLDGGGLTSWRGPGILDRRAMCLPLPAGFWAQRAPRAFPKGLDFFLTAGCEFVGLPRSTSVSPMMQEVA
ncbi:MAG: phosphonate C-P lyase system protein PhnH [Pusillimonas sp.]